MLQLNARRGFTIRSDGESTSPAWTTGTRADFPATPVSFEAVTPGRRSADDQHHVRADEHDRGHRDDDDGAAVYGGALRPRRGDAR